MIVNLSQQHSLISNWVAELRDVDIQNDRMRFRRNLERIGDHATNIAEEVIYWIQGRDIRHNRSHPLPGQLVPMLKQSER